MSLPARAGPASPSETTETLVRSGPGRFRTITPLYSTRNHHVEADSPHRRRAHPRIRPAIARDARAQGAGRGPRRPAAGGRSPSPGRPGKPERIRFVDVKHIKAELTLDTKKREVRGTVTHTLRPLHPYLKTVELDCGRSSRSTQVTVGPKAGPVHLHAARATRCRSRSTSPTGPAIRSTWRSSTPARPTAAPLRPARPGLPREAAGHLDPGRGRGHAPLAPLLRLSRTTAPPPR